MSPADVSNTDLASMSLSTVTRVGASKLWLILMCRLGCPLDSQRRYSHNLNTVGEGHGRLLNA